MCPLTYSREVYWLLTYRCTEGAGKCQHTSRSRKQTLTWYIKCLVVNNIPWDCTNCTNLNCQITSTYVYSWVTLNAKMSFFGTHACTETFAILKFMTSMNWSRVWQRGSGQSVLDDTWMNSTNVSSVYSCQMRAFNMIQEHRRANSVFLMSSMFMFVLRSKTRHHS